MRVGVIVTCFDREAYWPYLERIIRSYSRIEPDIAYCYNGSDATHPCDVRLKNEGLSLGDFSLTLAGYRLLIERNTSNPLTRFIKLSVDSWPCDDAALVTIFTHMEAHQACYGGNLWHRNLDGSLSTDIFFADIRYGNIFETLIAQGHQKDFEDTMARAVRSLGKPYLIPERHPVHTSNRHRCEKLKWTMEHNLRANLDYLNTMHFADIYEAISALTVVSRDRCHMLYRLSKYASILPGDIAEVGVYRGGTSLLLAAANPKKTIHVFDTFSGTPNADPKYDRHVNGDFADFDADATIGALLAAGVQVHKGYFPKTANGMDGPYCFSHFDGDTYQSCRDFLSYFWPRLTIGGIMVFDAWRWERCPGVERAVLEHCDIYGCWPYQTATHQVAVTVCRSQ